jgi:uncharacterized protein (TIGR03083 family)
MRKVDTTVTEGAVSAAYRGCRMRLTELLAGVDRRQAETPVTTCPGWVVHDVLAHVSGGVVDAINGRMEGVGTDPWTAHQVNERREKSFAEILVEWNTYAPRVEPLLDSAGDLGRQAVTDVVSHEHDIRAALNLPGARSTDAVGIGLTFAAARLVESAEALGSSLRVEGGGMVFGADDPDVTVRGGAFELLRAITGRRSLGQIRQLAWEGDVETVVPAFWWYGLSPAAEDIRE